LIRRLRSILHTRTLRNILTLAILGAGIHLILPQISVLRTSWQVMASMAWWAVGLAFVAQAFSYLGSGFMLQGFLETTRQKIALWLSTLVVIGANSIGMVAGGTVGVSAAIYRWTGGSEGSMKGATLASLLSPLFINFILTLISIFGLVHLILAHSLTKAQALGFSLTPLILALALSSAILAVRYREQAVRAVLWVSRQMGHLRRKPFDPHPIQKEAEELFTAMDVLLHGAWQKPALGAFLSVLFDMLTLYFMFLATDSHVNPGVLMAGYGLPLLLGKAAFILPGGVGIVESSMALMYNGLGVPQNITIIVVLGYRLISFWLPSIAGFPIGAFLERSQGRFLRKDNEATL
jgi:glycosyltransferase 2 family protein